MIKQVNALTLDHAIKYLTMHLVYLQSAKTPNPIAIQDVQWIIKELKESQK